MTDTPGLPDPNLVRGNWTGEADTPTERQAAAYRETRARLMRLHTELCGLRARWATSDMPGAIARAVAYQSVAGSVAQIIQDGDRRAAP